MRSRELPRGMGQSGTYRKERVSGARILAESSRQVSALMPDFAETSSLAFVNILRELLYEFVYDPPAATSSRPFLRPPASFEIHEDTERYPVALSRAHRGSFIRVFLPRRRRIPSSTLEDKGTGAAGERVENLISILREEYPGRNR